MDGGGSVSLFLEVNFFVSKIPIFSCVLFIVPFRREGKDRKSSLFVVDD